jgi:hypothetical protein
MVERLMDDNLQASVRSVLDKVVFLQLIGSFDPLLDFAMTKQLAIDTHDFVRDSSETEVASKLPEIEQRLEPMVSLAKNKYPPKVDISTIASEWNSLFRADRGFFPYGIEYGWAHQLMDMANLGLYRDYVPYNFRIGLGPNKGFFSIEEDFLLRDSFAFLLKAIHTKSSLDRYAKRIKQADLLKGTTPNRKTYQNISNLKFEIASYARVAIISFYSFVECFVNSIGYSHFMYNQGSLSADSQELLKGKSKNRYLSLKEKVKRYPALLRGGSPAVGNQPDAERRDFFALYEELRNSSVHYSPLKAPIWLKPDDWLASAKHFSEIALQVARQFWADCFSRPEGPAYLGKFDYRRLFGEAEARLMISKKIDTADFLV